MGNLKFEAYFEVLYLLWVGDSHKTVKVDHCLSLVAPQQQFIKWVIIGKLNLYESYLEVLYPFIQCFLGASGD